MGRLAEKVAMVTGGSSGISRAVAKNYAAEGASILIADMQQEPREGGESTEELIRKSGGQAYWRHTDVIDPDSVEAATTETVERFGKLDILFCGAGVVEPTGETRDIAIEDFDRHHAINVRGVFLSAQAALRHMVPRHTGKIILVASNFGQVGVAGLATYCSSKAAVIGMTQALAVEYGKDGITVNALCPGATKTAINVAYRDDETTQELWRRETPLRMVDQAYIADPQDIAYGAVYLASEESRFMTGSCLRIDGGWNAH